MFWQLLSHPDRTSIGSTDLTGMMAGVGAEYISADSQFLEAKTRQQRNPLKLVQAQIQKASPTLHC